MKVFVGMLLALIATAASAQNYNNNRSNLYGGGLSGTGSNPNSHYVQPHYNLQSGGTTSGHYQTNPNTTQRDNYGVAPNVNPHNGVMGTGRARY